MQTLSPTISPTIAKSNNSKIADPENDFLPAIAQSSVLQTALAGLDASLNDELDRYRHWQENGQTISYLNPFRPRSISTQSIWTSPSVSDALSPIAPLERHSEHRHSLQMPVMPPMGTTSSPSINISTAELHSYRGIEDLKNVENRPDDHGIDLPYVENLHKGTPEPMLITPPTMAQDSEPDEDQILQSFINDYAETNQDETSRDFYPIAMPEQKGIIASLMNPVGIISLLLLLFSSAAIGYLLVDPSGVMQLFKNEPKNDPKSKASQNNVDNKDLGIDINLRSTRRTNDSGLSFVPFAGDRNDPLKALTNPTTAPTNPLTNLSPKTPAQGSKPSNLFAPSSTVPSSPLRTVPSTALPPISVAPLPPALAPVESYSPAAPVRQPEPVYSAPSAPVRKPASRPSSAARSTTPPPKSESTAYVAPAPSRSTAVKYAAPLSADPAPAPVSNAPASSYRVVVENSYASSAQQIDRDAYVRPTDGQVQVGSYRDPNVAQQRVEELRRQGIPARLE
ncbi:hypothetical protein [Pseudanabaena mucicola]|uniref:SPOR domain-containing protein n=1 Tax=Pseudanabaena mucicola FACHB-723 TaxID=2692860 RepID=A0ABR7ZW75_9CYAN|nr:hypothetical protein [Pseudanabaena mucicola]MBD2187501.1 hypothetical protein [Pseudanabaena mucicola FACHB-723]